MLVLTSHGTKIPDGTSAGVSKILSFSNLTLGFWGKVPPFEGSFSSLTDSCSRRDSIVLIAIVIAVRYVGGFAMPMNCVREGLFTSLLR